MHWPLSTASEKEALWEEIQRLRKAVDEVQEELNKTRQELEDYKKRHPENVGVKHGKAYEIKPETNPATATGASKKKPGGQPGHEGHTRPVPQRVDRRVRLRLKECPNGRGHRLSRVQETRPRTVEDAPMVQSIVTEYEIERRWCRDCGKLVEPCVPGVLPGAQVGLRAMLIVAWLRIALRLTEDAVPQVLHSLCGVRISQGEVQGILDQLAHAYGPFYESLLHDLREAAGKYADESTWRTNGRNQYMWTFVTRWEAIYRVTETRHHDIALEVLGPKPKGILASDGFSGYNTVARKTGLLHQRCWTHVLGDAKELAEFRPQEGQRLLDGLKSIYARAAEFNGKGTPADVDALTDAMRALLDRSFDSHKCAGFARNTLNVADQLFVFVTHAEIEGTNNRAERAIRPVVIARKISGGSRSDKGATVRALLTSVLTTLKLRGINPLSGLGLRPQPTSDG